MKQGKESPPGIGVRAAGWLGLLGCLVMLATSIIAPLMLPDMNAVAHTISNYAAGKLAWIQDLGLYALALGLAAVGIALYHLHLGGFIWGMGSVFLVLAGAGICVVGAYNEYGDGDSSGLVIHWKLMWGVGIAFSVALLSLMQGLWRLRRGLGIATLVVAVIWTISAPFFPLVPLAWDGIYERVISLGALLWLAAVSWTLARWS